MSVLLLRRRRILQAFVEREFLKHVHGVRGNTATLIVLAEFGRYPLRFHWWQQILRYHNRINNLSDDGRLIQCALMEGLHDQAYHFWSHGVQRWLQLQSTALNIEDEICVSTVINNAKAVYRQAFHQADHSVGRYRQMLQVQHQDYELAPYLSTVKYFKNRRVVSRFRCGCHGLHVDTGEFKPVGQKVDREQRFCLVCASDTTEDEHHFVFDCPAYCSVRDRYTAIFWGPAPTLSSFFTLHDPSINWVGGQDPGRVLVSGLQVSFVCEIGTIDEATVPEEPRVCASDKRTTRVQC